MYPWFHLDDARSTNSVGFLTRSELSSESGDYAIVAQDAIEVQDIQNAPAVSMRGFLAGAREMNILSTISIYKRDGYDRKHTRLLYMNATALRLWTTWAKTQGRSERNIVHRTRLCLY